MWVVWAILAVLPQAHAKTQGGWAPKASVPLGDRMPAAFTVAELQGRGVDPGSDHRHTMLDHARALGWPARGAEFQGPDRTVEARFVLHGEVRASTSMVRERRRGHAVEVWWQLVDRRHDQVLYEVSTLGWGPGGSTDPAMVAAFGQVLSREPFVDALEAAGRRAFFERAEPVTVRTCTDAFATTARRATVSVRQLDRRAAGAVISPDGLVWTAAHTIADPSAPILVHTPHGRLPAQWIHADADADVALLALPVTEHIGCTPLAARIPHVRDVVRTFTASRRRLDTQVSGFRLQQHPPRIEVDAHATVHPSPVYDTDGALVGMCTGSAVGFVVRPHQALTDALRIQWSSVRSALPIPAARTAIIDQPDPGFASPPQR